MFLVNKCKTIKPFIESIMNDFHLGPCQCSQTGTASGYFSGRLKICYHESTQSSDSPNSRYMSASWHLGGRRFEHHQNYHLYVAGYLQTMLTVYYLGHVVTYTIERVNAHYF